MGNMIQNGDWLKNEDIGVEIEMAKLSKEKACKIVNDYFNEKYGYSNEYWYDGRHHADYACNGKPDSNGNARIWRFMDDGSSSGDWGSISCEMVTPILYYDDIEDLQAIVRLLRTNGARSGAHYNAGVHIHVGAKANRENGQTPKSIRNLVNLIASHEPLLCQAIAVTPSRVSQWARFVEPYFLRAINNKKPKTWDKLGELWYGSRYDYERGCRTHYHSSRYHLLNLHALWDKGTIEFRCFEFHNNLHAGELKAWIQLCMAMCSYVKHVNYCSPKPMEVVNQKYSLKNWLNNLGLVGDEFKTCRKMLTKHLRGDTAYKNGRPNDDNDLDDANVDLMDTPDVVRG